MAIITNDGLIAGLDGQQIFKGSATFTPQATASFTSLWKSPGNPGPGATPTATLTGEIETDLDVGTYLYTSINQSYIGWIQVSSTTAGTLLMYDRLWATSGLNATSVAAQTINNTALTRDTTGKNVEAWYDVYAVMGAGVGTITMNYTDQDGNTANVSSAHTNITTMAAFRALPLNLLAAGDMGVRAIESVTFNTSRTSGTAGLTLRRQLASIPTPANTGISLNAFQLGMPKIGTDSAIEFMWLSSGSAATTISWCFGIIQG